MNLFETVKDSITAKDAALYYGVPINRAGMACCVFHDDHTPSMKVDERFHCFGCGADGDVIDFTARLFDLSLKEAAEKLAADFNIAYDRQPDAVPIRRTAPVIARRSLLQRLNNYRDANYRTLCNYLHLLKDWQRQYEPKPNDEEWHPLFLEALQNIDRVDYLLDELQGCTAEEAKDLIATHKNEIAEYAGRVREFTHRSRREKKEAVR